MLYRTQKLRQPNMTEFPFWQIQRRLDPGEQDPPVFQGEPERTRRHHRVGVGHQGAGGLGQVADLGGPPGKEDIDLGPGRIKRL